LNFEVVIEIVIDIDIARALGIAAASFLKED
jgi:hypothetical protein